MPTFTSLTCATLRLPTGFEFEAERQAAEMGILDGVIVELPDGTCFSVCFIGCNRLDKEVAQAQPVAKPYFARPGLIVVTRVSTWISTLAACWAASQNYFLQLNPTPCPTLVPDKISISYPEGDKDGTLQNAQDRGYIEAVDVQLDDGPHYKLTFMIPIRLRQEIEADALNGRPFFIEPGLIVVPDIDSDVISVAVHDLGRQGYFGHLKPTE